MINKDEYNGWSNRETWAVKLHWDNNQGDYTYFTEQVKALVSQKMPLNAVADWLQEQAKAIYENVLNSVEETITKEAKMFIQDVGSLWRVDWREIAEAYIKEVKE